MGALDWSVGIALWGHATQANVVQVFHTQICISAIVRETMAQAVQTGTGSAVSNN